MDDTVSRWLLRGTCLSDSRCNPKRLLDNLHSSSCSGVVRFLLFHRHIVEVFGRGALIFSPLCTRIIIFFDLFLTATLIALLLVADCCSLLAARCSPLASRRSPLVACCSLLTAHCSLLTARCSLLDCCCFSSDFIFIGMLFIGPSIKSTKYVGGATVVILSDSRLISRA